MYEEEYVLDALVYIAGGLFSFWYGEAFLKRRFEIRKKAAILWAVLYAGAQMLCEEIISPYPLYSRFAHSLQYLVLLPLLQRFFFERNVPRQAFVTISFVAGWEILRFTVSPLAHAVFGLWSPFWGWMVDDFVAGDIVPAEELMGYMLILNRAVIFAVLALCRGIQIGIFYLYLRLIVRYFIPLETELQAREIWYLIAPCITVLVIDLTLRLMAYSADNSALMLVYDRVPETLVLLPVTSLLLLGIIVSSVVLFRSLYDFKEEEKKRLLLENRVGDVHRQIEDLQGIYQDMRGLRHDLRAHIAGIAAFVRNRGLGGQSEIAEYLSGMESAAGRLDFADQTGSPITDIILHQARQQARRKGIEFSADFRYPAEKGYDVYDISIILNNALQNAIEATMKLSGRRKIEVRSFEKGGLFFIETENDFDGNLLMGEGEDLPATTKAERDMHGIGLINIRRSAQKYLGDIEIETHEANGRKIFRLTVMLYRGNGDGCILTE